MVAQCIGLERKRVGQQIQMGSFVSGWIDGSSLQQLLRLFWLHSGKVVFLHSVFNSDWILHQVHEIVETSGGRGTLHKHNFLSPQILQLAGFQHMGKKTKGISRPFPGERGKGRIWRPGEDVPHQKQPAFRKANMPRMAPRFWNATPASASFLL